MEGANRRGPFGCLTHGLIIIAHLSCLIVPINSCNKHVISIAWIYTKKLTWLHFVIAKLLYRWLCLVYLVKLGRGEVCSKCTSFQIYAVSERWCASSRTTMIFWVRRLKAWPNRLRRGNANWSADLTWSFTWLSCDLPHSKRRYNTS